MFFDQSLHSVRFEWGERGIDALGPSSDVIVIVDVLSFTTCVDAVVSRGGTVLPYPMRDGSAASYAEGNNAILAHKRQQEGFSLSPRSLDTLESGTRLVLPSPNGSTLSLRAVKYGSTLAGCLRNASAIGGWVSASGGSVAIIAAGERWEDGTLRPSWEDLVGAGAIISHLPGSRSPEAQAAFEVYQSAKSDLERHMMECSSGRQLAESGFRDDVEFASEYSVSTTVPFLNGGEFVDRAGA